MTGTNRHVRIVEPALALLALAVLWYAGCSPNDPFDPESVPNSPPTVRLFVGPVEPGGDLNPTSYFQRTFRWSGSDADGFVTEYYVSVRIDSDVPAPWDTTTSTDTTMTFTTDAQGEAEATFLLVCRDNRGALSDTVVQFVPLKNFPPVIGFQSDFDPLKNLQREFRDADGNVTENAADAADTVYWNWGAMGFRMSASDPDGRPTLDPFFRYTVADVLPDSTYDQDDPRSDPETAWVRVPLLGEEEFAKFEIFLPEVQPGTRTLTVSVKDEAGSDPMFQYQWVVRAPSGPVLYIPDASSSMTRGFYQDYLDATFGPGNWDKYSFWFGFPENPAVLLHTMRKFEAVLWTDSGSASLNLAAASEKDGVLFQLINPTDGAPPGRLLLVSKVLVGNDRRLSNPFIETVLGVGIDGSPVTKLKMQPGKLALGQADHLVDMAYTKNTTNAGIGLNPKTDFDNEILYRMEECNPRDPENMAEGDPCYGVRPPFDPIVGIRVPQRTSEALARLIGISLQLDEFETLDVHEALDVILGVEFGVSP